MIRMTNFVGVWTLLWTVISLQDLSSAVIRPRQHSIFRVKSIQKVLPIGNSGADFTITAKIESTSDLGQNFNGSLRLAPSYQHRLVAPFERTNGSRTLYEASLDVVGSANFEDVILDLNSGNESLLFSLRLNALSFNIEATPTNFYNSITFMIYQYAVPQGMRYAVDIEPKIRSFWVTSTFSVSFERPVGNTWVKVSNTGAYSSGFISDRFASITLNQTAMAADRIRVGRLAYLLIASADMTGATRSGNAISTYRII